MELSSQLHAPAEVSTEQEVGSAPGPVWTLCRKGNLLNKDLNIMDDNKFKRLGEAGNIIRMENERIPKNGS